MLDDGARELACTRADRFDSRAAAPMRLRGFPFRLPALIFRLDAVRNVKPPLACGCMTPGERSVWLTPATVWRLPRPVV